MHAETIAHYDAVVLLGERFGTPALLGAPRLLAVARWGVGYDTVDVAACTAHDVCVFITPDGVRRPVAVSILTFLLAVGAPRAGQRCVGPPGRVAPQGRVHG